MAECQRCWDWRKLDGPAARHWAKVAETFLSNVDTYDYIHYLPAALGDDQRGVEMIKAAWDLMHYSKGQVIMHSLHLEEQGPRP